jgi:hypothetical protein
MKTPIQARLYMLGLLYIVAFLGVQLALPAGHGLRAMTGGSAAPWLILGGGVGLVWAIAAILRRHSRAGRGR